MSKVKKRVQLSLAVIFLKILETIDNEKKRKLKLMMSETKEEEEEEEEEANSSLLLHKAKVKVKVFCEPIGAHAATCCDMNPMKVMMSHMISQ